MINSLLRWLKQRSCKHEFCIGQGITLTGIKPLPSPEKYAGYDEWRSYFSNTYKERAHTHRVYGECHKCRKGFYAHCGLDLNGKKIQLRK